MTFMHFEPHAIGIAFASYPLIFIGLMILIALLSYAIYFSAPKKTQQWHYLTAGIALLASVWFANGSSPGRLVTNLYKYYQAQFIPTASAESVQGLSAYGIHPTSIRKNAITAEFESKPKNLVIIYLESFSYFFTNHPEYPQLTPHLNALAEQYSPLTNYHSAARFTMEGLISSQCGVMPNIQFGNDIVVDESPFETLPCLSDVLDHLDYHQEFIGGARKLFSNKNSFLSMKAFDRVWGWEDFENEPGIEKNGWGLHDDQLYALAIDRAKALKNKGQPFHLNVLNLATHLNGYPAPSCQPYTLGKTQHPFLDGIHCIDQLVGQFIEQLKAEKMLDDTVVYITSDHGVFKVELIKELFGSDQNRDQIFGLLINQQTPQQAHTQPLALYDTAPIVLDALAIDSNVEFINGLPLSQVPPDRYLLRPKQLVSEFVHKDPRQCEEVEEIKPPITFCMHQTLVKKNTSFLQLFRKKNMLLAMGPVDLALKHIEITANHKPGKFSQLIINGQDQGDLFSYIGNPIQHNHRRFRNHLYAWIYDLENKVTLQRRAFTLNPALKVDLGNLLAGIESDYLAVFFTEGVQKIDDPEALSATFSTFGFNDFRPPEKAFVATLVSRNEQYDLTVFPTEGQDNKSMTVVLDNKKIETILNQPLDTSHQENN